MPDSTLAAMAEATSLDDEDLLYLVTDPSGAPADKKLKIATLREVLRIDPMGAHYAGIDNRYVFAEEFGPDEGYDEEFDGVNIADNTLPTHWSMVNQDASVYRQAFGAGRVDWGGGGDGTEHHACVRTLPATTTFDAFLHTFGASDLTNTPEGRYVNGVCLYNSVNGDFVIAGLHQWDTTPAAVNPETKRTPEFFVIHASDADTHGTTFATASIQVPSVGARVWWRITKASDSSYSFFANGDGGCWFTLGAALNVQATLGGDPTHIGFTINTPGAGHVGCEYLRIRNLT